MESGFHRSRSSTSSLSGRALQSIQAVRAFLAAVRKSPASWASMAIDIASLIAEIGSQDGVLIRTRLTPRPA